MNWNCPYLDKCEKKSDAERQDDYCYTTSWGTYKDCPTYRKWKRVIIVDDKE